MLQDIKATKFIPVERGLMLFMISAGATFLTVVRLLGHQRFLGVLALHLSAEML